MKFNISREWIMEKAELERGCSVEAGMWPIGTGLSIAHYAHLLRRHAKIMANVERLINRPGKQARRRLRHWAGMCERIERKLWPISQPTPAEAAAFRAEWR
jgi:hypothetical protein